MSSVRIAATEKIGRTPSEPYCYASLQRTASLDPGLNEVTERDVSTVRLEFGFKPETRKAFDFHPRHLPALIELLEDARARVEDREPLAEWERDLLGSVDAERIAAVKDLAETLLASEAHHDHFIGLAIFGALGLPDPNYTPED